MIMNSKIFALTLLFSLPLCAMNNEEPKAQIQSIELLRTVVLTKKAQEQQQHISTIKEKELALKEEKSTLSQQMIQTMNDHESKITLHKNALRGMLETITSLEKDQESINLKIKDLKSKAGNEESYISDLQKQLNEMKNNTYNPGWIAWLFKRG